MARKYRYFINREIGLLIVERPDGVVPFHLTILEQNGQTLTQFADHFEGAPKAMYGAWKTFDLSDYTEVFP